MTNKMNWTYANADNHQHLNKKIKLFFEQQFYKMSELQNDKFNLPILCGDWSSLQFNARQSKFQDDQMYCEDHTFGRIPPVSKRFVGQPVRIIKFC